MMCRLTRKLHYIAQEWITGTQYCSYSVVRKGKLQAFAVYPVIETSDGSSCVYFQAIEHPGIRHYCDEVVENIPDTTSQIALDFMKGGGRIFAIECHPRATSGIHLYSRTTHLATALTNPNADPPTIAKVGYPPPSRSGDDDVGEEGRHRQTVVTAHRPADGSRDVIFTTHDIWPVLMQPFLFMTYYKI